MWVATPSNPRAWLTTDDEPGNIVCYRVFYPANYLHVLMGAISLMTDESNWQQEGTTTVEEISSAFLAAYVETVTGGACMPTGAIVAYAGGTIPDGFLLCDGTQYNTVDYPQLFNAIGYAWGGSGSMFSVPNLVDRFVVGSGGDFSLADTGGEKNVTLTENQIPSHDHSIPGTLTTLNEVPVGTTPVLTPNPIGSNTGNTGGGGSHNNMPPYAAMVFIIKA